MKLELQNIKKVFGKKEVLHGISFTAVVVLLDYSDAMALVKQQLFVY